MNETSILVTVRHGASIGESALALFEACIYKCVLAPCTSRYYRYTCIVTCIFDIFVCYAMYTHYTLLLDNKWTYQI